MDHLVKFMFSGIVNQLKHRQMGYYKALGACPRKEAEVFLLRTTGRPLKEEVQAATPKVLHYSDHKVSPTHLFVPLFCFSTLQYE